MSIVDDVEAEIMKEFRHWATSTCPNALRDAINATCTPGAHRTGTLAGMVGSKQISDELFHVGTSAYYGKWVDEGRGRVVPRGSNALRFVAPSGAVIFTKHSNPSVPRMFIAAAVSRLQ